MVVEVKAGAALSGPYPNPNPDSNWKAVAASSGVAHGMEHRAGQGDGPRTHSGFVKLFNIQKEPCARTPRCMAYP